MRAAGRAGAAYATGTTAGTAQLRHAIVGPPGAAVKVAAWSRGAGPGACAAARPSPAQSTADSNARADGIPSNMSRRILIVKVRHGS
jgi:hypothetical protein